MMQANGLQVGMKVRYPGRPELVCTIEDVETGVDGPRVLLHYPGSNERTDHVEHKLWLSPDEVADLLPG